MAVRNAESVKEAEAAPKPQEDIESVAELAKIAEEVKANNGSKASDIDSCNSTEGHGNKRVDRECLAMDFPKQTKLVSGLPSSVPFVGPETQERARGEAFLTRLGANESVFGPSPRVIEAMSKAARDTWMYADPENYDLKNSLAAHHGVSPSNIVVGEGIDGLLGYLCRMYVEPGIKVVTSAGAYPTFNFHVSGYGGELVQVPYSGDFENPEALLEASDGARLVYIANPDNPMGSVHEPQVILSMMDRLPDQALLVLDEAYCEFAKELAPLDVSRKNVIRFRTFSKAYGMAGARVGYGIAHESIATDFDKIRNHFGMSRVSVAGALAALNDQDYLEDVLEKISASKDRIGVIGRHNDLQPLPSATNFVTLDCGRDGDFARALLGALVERGVFVRMPFVAPQDRCIRISAGKPEDLDIFAQVLPEALASVSE